MSSPMDLDRAPQRSFLLDLPAELRNQIYQLLLSSDEPLDASKPIAQPSLTRVCRQMRDESLAWFYTRNLFSIPVCNGNLSELTAFAILTPIEALWMIRDWGRLSVCTRYTSIFDMPISQSAADWAQPFTGTTETTLDYLFAQHMLRDESPMKYEETGRMLLDWLLQPNVLDKLQQERRMGATFSDMHKMKIRTDAQLQSVGYHLC